MAYPRRTSRDEIKNVNTIERRNAVFESKGVSGGIREGFIWIAAEMKTIEKPNSIPVNKRFTEKFKY
jgi:hypothetical protein